MKNTVLGNRIFPVVLILCIMTALCAIFAFAFSPSSEAPNPGSVWNYLGIEKDSIDTIYISYGTQRVALTPSLQEKLLESLHSAKPKNAAGIHKYDVSEFQLTFCASEKEITPSFRWFSGIVIESDPAILYSDQHLFDDRFDLSLDGESFISFSFEKKENVWNEYHSRRAFDQSSQAAGLLRRGALDGFDTWTDAQGARPGGWPINPDHTWQSMLDQCEAVIIGKYTGPIQYPYLFHDDTGQWISANITYTLDLFSVVSVLSGDYELDKVFVNTDHEEGRSSSLLVVDPDGTFQTDGWIPPVSARKYHKGLEYLILYLGAQENRPYDQTIYQAYPIDDGMIYPWYNTELELFNGTPLEEVEAYLAEKKQQ